MLQKPLHTIWKEMAIEHKVNVVGVCFMIISLFFPWYSDIDNFRTGDTYLGVTGPLFLAGLTLFTIATASLAISVFNVFKSKLRHPFFKQNLGIAQLSGGILSFYLLFLINSVYFHPQFGLNVNSKESGLGVLIAFLASSFMTIGGFLNFRNKKLVKIPLQQEISQFEDINIYSTENLNPTENFRKQGGLQKITFTNQKEQANTTPSNTDLDQSAVNPSPPESVEKSVEKKYQPYRMDL